MPRFRPILAAALLATSALSAAAEPTFSSDRLRADVSFLGDDYLEGRETGTRGHEIAARFVAVRFAALGLTPAAGKGWFQPIALTRATNDPAVPSSIGFAGRRFVDGDHAILSPPATAKGIGGEAGAVFVGYGLEETSLGLDDYRGLDLRGKIAVALRGTPTGLPSEIAATLNTTKPDIAARHGAVGLITLATPASLARTPWAKAVAARNLAQMQWLRPDGRANTANPSLVLNAYLDPVATDLLFAATPLANGGIARAIADRSQRPRGFALPGRIRVDRRGRIAPANSENVVALLPGSDPRLGREVLILSAHLDHLGLVTPNAKGDGIMNGVLDNAAGVAVILEVARAFVDSGRAPRRSILFVALTGEEKGELGSDYLAHYPVLKGKTVVADLNLDMPILTYDFQDVVAYGAEHSTIQPAVARAAAAMGIRLSPDPEPDQNRFTRSDQFSFAQAGIPSAIIKTGWAGPGKKAVEDFIAHHYHEVSDDLSNPIDWRAAAKFARLNYLVARDLADGADTPRWYDGDWFGNRYAPRAPKAKRR